MYNIVLNIILLKGIHRVAQYLRFPKKALLATFGEFDEITLLLFLFLIQKSKPIYIYILYYLLSNTVSSQIFF